MKKHAPFGTPQPCESPEHAGALKQAAENGPTPDEYADMSLFFSIFADGTRLLIISLLAGGELCVGHICAAVGISQSAVSHQLAVMRRMNIVKARREGRQVLYSLINLL